MAVARLATASSRTTRSSTSMLGLGSSGPKVLELQKALLAAGFNPHGLDGKFGPMTRAAVVAFQTARHLVVDGKVGPQTWGALRAAPAPAPKPTPAPSTAMLGKGSSGPQVLALQKALLGAGFNPHGLDGKFGPMTEAAVIAFQRARGLTVDGKVGVQTWAALAFPSTPAPTTSSGRVNGMLAWARSMLGTPYAAVNPFRFGDVLWDGQAHTSVNGSGTVWKYPAGTRVFDCSGFVVAAFRKLGVDLYARGLASSSTIGADTRFLQTLTRDQLAPGDLITYTPHDGIGHVVIYLGNGKTIESAGGVGVVIRDVDWARAANFKRVPLP